MVERLEQSLREAWRIPMSAFLIVNEDQILEVLDQIRTAIPKEIRQAQRVIQDRDRSITQAEGEAERIIQQAREEAARLAEEHELIAVANQRAQTIIERAHRDAEALKVEADEYARRVLLDLDNQLGTLESQIASLMMTVRNGLEKLGTQVQEPG